LVPVDSGVRRDAELRALFRGVQFASRDVDDDAPESLVADQQVAASAEDEEADSLLPRKAIRLEYVAVGLGVDEKARWTANSERGVRSERNILLNLHEF
jgi:hypothetical protein